MVPLPGAPQINRATQLSPICTRPSSGTCRLYSCRSRFCEFPRAWLSCLCKYPPHDFDLPSSYSSSSLSSTEFLEISLVFGWWISAFDFIRYRMKALWWHLGYLPVLEIIEVFVYQFIFGYIILVICYIELVNIHSSAVTELGTEFYYCYCGDMILRYEKKRICQEDWWNSLSYSLVNASNWSGKTTWMGTC